jgi:hypothetical protein
METHATLEGGSFESVEVGVGPSEVVVLREDETRSAADGRAAMRERTTTVTHSKPLLTMVWICFVVFEPSVLVKTLERVTDLRRRRARAMGLMSGERDQWILRGFARD